VPSAEDEIDDASAGRLAAAVDAREVSAAELAEAAAGRAQTRGAELNAVAVPLYAEAAAAAARIDARPAGRRLEGVPVSLKETLWVRGTPCCAGVERLAGSRSRSDGAVARALRRAGAVILCKGNVAQLNWYAESDNPVYGRTDNPWAADRSPGGSSGGEAALVAAGVVPVAVGTDIGGSVRIPAAWCGVFGMAPTPGRLSVAGSRDDQLFAGQTLIQNRPGVLARTAADLRLVISVLDVGPPAAAPVRSPGRVGVVRDNGVLAPAPAIRRAVAEVADGLAADGLDVIDVDLADAPEALALFDAVFAADGGRCLRRILRGGRATAEVRRALAAAADAALGPEELQRLSERIGALRRRFAEMLDREGVDALIGPAHAIAAVPHGAALDVVAGQSYTSLYNLLGMPAGVAPVTRVGPGEESDRGGDAPAAARRAEAGSAGLPVAVQVAARPGDDEVVLTLLARISSH
jgi:fatty acid amide hydrolase